MLPVLQYFAKQFWVVFFFLWGWEWGAPLWHASVNCFGAFPLLSEPVSEALSEPTSETDGMDCTAAKNALQLTTFLSQQKKK